MNRPETHPLMKCASPLALSDAQESARGLAHSKGTATVVPGRAGLRHILRDRPEIFVFLALTLLFSAPALSGAFSYSLIFLPDAVRHGECWRLLTHPFVHVTRYHLLLDGAAFFLLYIGLAEARLLRRLTYVGAGAAGSLLLAWAATPRMATTGLCGLSGIAHGLMAVSALEMMQGRPRGSREWRLGAITLSVVAGKALIEAWSGRALFGFLYFNLMGDPIAVSHAGGIAGCLAAMLCFGLRREAKRHAAFARSIGCAKRCRRYALPPQSKSATPSL